MPQLQPQVGSNLQDHLLLGGAHLTTQPTPDAGRMADGMQGMAYFSFPTEGSRTTGETDLSTGLDAATFPAAAAAAATATATASATGTECSAKPSASPVLGYLFWDGNFLEMEAHLLVDFLLRKPGVLNAVLRVVICFVAWVAVKLTPLGGFLRKRTRGAAMLLTTVKSRGTVRLRSRDATAPPDIDPAYMSCQDDARAWFESWRILRRATRETVEGKASLGLELSPGIM